MILVCFAGDNEPNVYESDNEAKLAMSYRPVAYAKVVHYFHPIRKPETAKLAEHLRGYHGAVEHSGCLSVTISGDMARAFLAEWPDATH
jgi:hypothetical protein